MKARHDALSDVRCDRNCQYQSAAHIEPDGDDGEGVDVWQVRASKDFMAQRAC